MTSGVIQRSFAGGEIAPALGARADQIKYQTGLRKCRNFRVQKHGGIANRPGTQLVAEVLDSAVQTYLLDFQFNDEQTYIIEAGDFYFRFYRNGARIVVSGVAAWVTATPYAVADLRQNGGVNYYCYSAHTSGALTEPGVGANWATVWYALEGNIYEIPTPYAAADVPLLKTTQSGDVVTIAHASYAPRELTRTGHTAWTLGLKAFAPGIATPTGFAVTAPGAGADTWRYRVTAVMEETYEESLPASASDTGNAPATANIHALTWNVVAGAAEYWVYREFPRDSGVYGFLAICETNTFNYDGSITPDTSTTPPIARTPFGSTNNYPDTTGYYQQRQLFANTNNDPEKLWTSRSAMFNNFTISSPLQDDDAVTFTVAGRKVNEIRHLIDLGVLVLLTASGEWLVEGDSEGVLRASQPPNLRQVGYNGSSDVAPMLIDTNVLYLQARGNVIRDLRYEVQGGGTLGTYKGRDLTVFATHLFKNRQITRMAYAQTPDSIGYAVRDDGVLLGLTYLPEHEIWGWHWHDTEGWYEDVRVAPEGDEDAVYVIVRRIINGVTKRYIERSTTRDFEDITADAVFLDSYLSYDGRNTSATTLSLSTGAGWTVDDVITVTASAPTFVPTEAGNEFVLNIVDDDEASETFGEVIETVTITITGYTSNVVVTGTPSKTVPVALQGVATSHWSRAVDELLGLDHLEGKNVGVFADGHVVASPNNEDYAVITVSGGGITLDACYSVIHVGLPYVSDMRTLDLDKVGTEWRDRMKSVTHIALLVEQTRGLFAGPDLDSLTEFIPEPVENYNEAVPMADGLIEMTIASTWNESGGFWVRQVDPLPVTILAAIPAGELGG